MCECLSVILNYFNNPERRTIYLGNCYVESYPHIATNCDPFLYSGGNILIVVRLFFFKSGGIPTTVA